MRRLRKLFLIVLSLCWHCSNAQYQYNAPIKPVDSSGFYAIDITSGLSSYVSVSFKDIRIVDKAQKQVPYIIRSAAASSFISEYKSLKIHSTQSTDSTQSVILENISKEKITQIGLLLKNAAVTRSVNISGSDDNQKWFTISEGLLLENSYTPTKDEYVENISIPLSSYSYFRVVINNRKNDPLNILSAGYNLNKEIKIMPEYVDNGPSSFRQVDSSDNNTYVFITHAGPYQFDALGIKVVAPKYYKRYADVVIDNHINSYIISSDTLIHFSFPSTKALKYYIKISNGDNPPIKIVNVSTAQLKKQLVTWMEKNGSYELLLGNPKAMAPQYDLTSFRDSIPFVLPKLGIGEIAPTKKLAEAEAKFNTRNLLWPAIIVVILILGLLTFRLSKEVEKK
jgi:hypothetical protein